MRVLILGIDGYLGWPLALHLGVRGFEVAGVDVLYRRDWVKGVGGWSAVPIETPYERERAYRERIGRHLDFREGSLARHLWLEDVFHKLRPDVIVHLAEQPSAPFSMMDFEHCRATYENNVSGTLVVLWAMKEVCPRAHLVKLGSMGEYGTPGVDIPEGGAFPKQPGSFYHATKCADSLNVELACKVWGLSSTDVMQGVVLGSRTVEMADDARLRTRVDFDQYFGTVVNRFCAQAVIGHPLTVYGSGGQKRGLIPLADVMRCLQLVIESPAIAGEYRVFNQFQQVVSVAELAAMVEGIAAGFGLDVKIASLENPRVEAEDHNYNPECFGLQALGYRPTDSIESDIQAILRDMLRYKDRIEAKRHVIVPDVRWDGKAWDTIGIMPVERLVCQGVC